MALNRSCVRCQEKKQRCNGQHPCSRCVRSDIAHLCVRAQRKKRSSKRARAGAESESDADASHLLTPSPFDSSAAPAPRSDNQVNDEGNECSSGESQQSAVTLSPPPPSLPSTGRSSTEARLSEMRCTRTLLGTRDESRRLLKRVFRDRCLIHILYCIDLNDLLRLLDRCIDDSDPLQWDELCLVQTSLAVSLQVAPSSVLADLHHRQSGHYARATALQLHERAMRLAHEHLLARPCRFVGLQALVVLLLTDLEDECTRHRIFDHAVRCAHTLGLHQRGSMADPPTQRAEELEIRLWWHLVSRDWMASFHRQSYSIHPQHFNARLPDVTDTQTNDPLVGFVPLYIGLAKLARQFFDARLHSASDRAASAASVAEVCRFMDALPSQYSLAADAARLRLEMGDFEAGRLQVHRWMLHQQVFHLCLRTSKLRFGEKVPRHLRVFGSHVLELQDEIRGICPVIDNLRMNVTSVASACTVLMLDLIASSTAQVTSMERQLTLSKVRLAVQQCQSADEGDENGPMGPITCLIRTEELLWSHKIASDSMLPGIELDEESAAVREGGGQVNNAHRTPPVSQTQGLGAPWVSFDGCLPRAVSPMQRGMSVATSPSPSFLPSDFGISPLFSAGPTWADLEPWLADVLQTTETQGLAAALSVSAHMAPET